MSHTGPLKIGDTFGKLEIRGLLGKGGHAWVYHAYDEFLDRHVALKVIPNPVETPERDMRERAQREARVLSKLEHENVVRLIDAGFTGDGAVYLVMEILRGRTWRDALNTFGPMNVVEALTLGAKIADGVHAAHGVKVIHRDLKPENVFVIENNGIKVLDFGIAKLFGPGEATTQRDLLHGTMKYMSPEHLLGLGVTMRSDIYALGTMLYEALCGRIPCEIGVQDPTRDALIYAQLKRRPPMLDELVPTVPNFVARTVRLMLAKDPQDRLASMAEVAQLLRTHLKRYLQEANGSAPTARDLWRLATPEARPDAALSHASTEVNQVSPLAPPTAPPVTLPTRHIQDASPASPRVSVQVTEPLRVIPPKPTSAAPVPAAPALTARPASVVEERPAPAPSKSQVAPLAAPQLSPLSPNRAGAARSRPKESWDLLTLCVSLGAAVGLIAGLVMYWQPRHTTTSAEEPVTVISAQQAPVGDVAPPSTATIATAAPHPELGLAARADLNPATSSAQATPLPAPPLPAVTPTAAPGIAAVAAPAPVPTVHAVKKPAAKPQPSSKRGGLWDMSDLDTPTPPKPALPAAGKSPNKAIYGGDEVAK